MSRDRRGAPWLDPIMYLGVSTEAFDALIFRTCLSMRLPVVGAALRHWERCYPLTASWLDQYDDLVDDAELLSAILLTEKEGTDGPGNA